MIKNSLLVLSILCLTLSCSVGQSSREGTPVSADSIRYAEGFTVERFENYTQVEVKNPWDSTRLLQRYLLIDREKQLPANLPKGTIVRIPVRRMVVYTSVHVAVVDRLHAINDVVGVCEPQYMQSIRSVVDGLDSGRIVNMGEAMNPNVERMIDAEPEVILVSPFEHTGYGSVEKLGIPLIECADYMESSPLGRAEWIRFIALFVDRDSLANELFAETEKKYLEVKALAAQAKNRPTVFTERKYGATWYVPTGESYLANFLQDAGADYIFKELPGKGSTPMDFEAVFDQAIHADYWLMKYNLAADMTYQQLASEYEPYRNFDAYKNRKVYGCNTATAPYYEETPMNPEFLLEDMVAIFHPELMPDYCMRYYREIGDRKEIGG